MMDLVIKLLRNRLTRTFMELKLPNAVDGVGKYVGLTRTFMELKQMPLICPKNAFSRLTRTFMELKLDDNRLWLVCHVSYSYLYGIETTEKHRGYLSGGSLTRTFMELKRANKALVSMTTQSLTRTFMELKQLRRMRLDSGISCLTRTFMELKLQR